MARRDARDRVFADRSTDHFEKVGETEADDIVNVSGMPSPNTTAVRRPRTVTAPPPGQHVSHRRPVEINAESGTTLDEGMQRTTLRAARKAENEKAAAGDDRLTFLFTGR